MFGDKLKEIILRKYSKFSEFADKYNIPRSTLSDILNNKKLPRESNLNLYISNLEPLSEEEKKELIKEWSFDRAKGHLKKEMQELEKENKNMLEVLREVKTEKQLMSEINNLKEYENFYNLFFKDLTSEETKIVLKSMLKELKIIALDKGTSDNFKTKFQEIEKIIESI